MSYPPESSRDEQQPDPVMFKVGAFFAFLSLLGYAGAVLFPSVRSPCILAWFVFGAASLFGRSTILMTIIGTVLLTGLFKWMGM